MNHFINTFDDINYTYKWKKTRFIDALHSTSSTTTKLIGFFLLYHKPWAHKWKNHSQKKKKNVEENNNKTKRINLFNKFEYINKF